MSRRVVVVGPSSPAVAAIERDLKGDAVHVVVADNVHHALLLLRAFAPDVLVAPSDLTDDDLALLLSSSSVPLVVVPETEIDVTAALDLVRQGVSRVVPLPLGRSVLSAVVDAPLHAERQVQRVLAQLGLLRCTGAIQVGEPLVGEILVDAGRFRSASAGALVGGEALKALALREDLVPWTFISGEEVLADVDVDLDIPVRNPSGDIVLDDIDVEDSSDVVNHRAPRTVEELAVLLPPTALVVEDDPDLARLYAILLRAKGFVCTIAYDGAEGYAAVCAAPFDVVLTDIMMPRQTGWDLLSLIRNNARLRELRVVLLSHHAEMVTRLKTANGGADGYLQKSMRPDAVVSAVVEVIRPRRELATVLAAGVARIDGSLANIGPQTLLRLLARYLVTGRLAVRGGAARYLIAFENGDVVDAQYALGATTLQHRDALRAMLLVDDGTFRFVSGAGPATAPATPVEPLLDELCVELEVLLETMRTDVLSAGTSLTVRPALLEVYRDGAPTAAKIIVDKIGQGMTPREIIAVGLADPVLVDSVVRDLFRKGVIAP